MTIFLLGIITSMAFTFMWSQSNGIEIADDRAKAQSDARFVVELISRELRQAQQRLLGDESGLVEYLDHDTIRFYTDRDADGDPEKVEYYVDDISGTGTFELRRRVWEPDAGSGPSWTYPVTPSTETALAARVLSAPGSSPGYTQQLFVGEEVTTGAVIATCSTPVTCNFDRVRMNLVFEVPATPDFTYEITQTTTFRNPHD